MVSVELLTLSNVRQIRATCESFGDNSVPRPDITLRGISAAGFPRSSQQQAGGVLLPRVVLLSGGGPLKNPPGGFERLAILQVERSLHFKSKATPLARSCHIHMATSWRRARSAGDGTGRSGLTAPMGSRNMSRSGGRMRDRFICMERELSACRLALVVHFRNPGERANGRRVFVGHFHQRRDVS
jgi:hypothetical protein